METTVKKQNYFIPIIVMILLFGMISFVTNLASPMGDILKNQFKIPNWQGTLGVFANFIAYAVMGIPSGNLLQKKGYKKTALIAVIVGFIGVGIQTLSGVFGSFAVYLLGAFVAGFSMCLLNTVVNPMLKLLGGRRSNQYIQIGGSFNSLMGTLTPMLVGALIGTLTAQSKIADVNPVLFIAMGVFAVAFVALLFIPIEDPEAVKTQVKAENPMNYRHFVYGVIAIFLYVGVEVGIPGTLNFFLSDSVNGAGLDPSVAVRTAGFVAGTYWFLMLIGRLISSFISGKVSSRAQLITVSTVALILVLCAMFIPVSNKASMPAFTGSGFSMVEVPLSALLLVLVGLCTSVMWGTIFDLAVEGLGAATNKASGIFMAMVVGGGILPLLQNFVADKAGYMPSYWVIVAGLAFIFFFAVAGSRVVKKAK